MFVSVILLISLPSDHVKLAEVRQTTPQYCCQVTNETMARMFLSVYAMFFLFQIRIRLTMIRNRRLISSDQWMPTCPSHPRQTTC